MIYGLIFAAALLTSLLLAAAATAHAARLKHRLWQEVVAAVFLALPAAASAALCTAFYLLFADGYLSIWPLVFAGSFLLLHVVGGMVILWKGLAGGPAGPVAHGWSRARLGLAFGLALFLFLTVYGLTDLARRTELAHVNAEIRGRACSLYPSPPPARLNAAPVYQEAYASLSTHGSLPYWLDYSEEPEQWALPPEVVDFLNNHRNAVPLIQKAASMPEFYLPFDASRMVGATIPSYDLYWRLARFLALHAGAEARRGNPAGAMENITAIRSMMTHLLSVPEPMAFSTATRVAAIGLQGLELVLAPDPRDVPMPALPLEADKTWRLSVVRVLRLEECRDLEGNVLMARCRSGREGFSRSFDLTRPISYPPVARSLWRVFLMRGELQCVRNTWARIDRIAGTPYDRNRQDLRALERLFEAEPRGRTMEDIYRYRSGLIDGGCARLDAFCRLMKLAVAATAYCQTTGRYPAAVADLVPVYLKTPPLDPFDGKPLKLASLPGGCRLFSAGDEEQRPIQAYLGARPFREKRFAPAVQAMEEKKNSKKAKKRRKAK